MATETVMLAEMVEVLELVSCQVPLELRSVIDKALALAAKAHEGQYRKHGEPYLVHPLRVVKTLIRDFGRCESELIAAALLHDVLEDAPDRVSLEDVRLACGYKTADLVQILTSPSPVEIPDKAIRNRKKAENVWAAPRDAWYIKLADRIDNLRDACRLIDESGRHFRARYHHESMEYYLPLAERLGDARVLAIFQEALARVRDALMDDQVVPGCVNGPGVELDVFRMYLPANLESRYADRLDKAMTEMQAIERGEFVNQDEGRQVGHYWLRNSALAPAEHREPIEAALHRIDAFYNHYLLARFKNILWIGIGGSSLGPQMLYDSLRTPASTPAMFFFDNTDPCGFLRVLREVEQAGGLKDTLTVVVSKSGGTRETEIGMLVAKAEYGKYGLKFENQAVAITKPGSKLDRLAGGEDLAAKRPPWLERFPIWDWVGGRTSLFSSVGILAAKLLGFDSVALRDGAKAMDDATRDRNLTTNPALLLATTWYHAVEILGLHNMVVLPYGDPLAMLSKYVQQLIMESLGKDGKGITVFGNKGTTDQHSYIQQLQEGRRDFFVTFIRVPPAADADWEIEPGITAGDWLMAFQAGTADSLSDAGRLSLRITLEKRNERTIGALISLFERAVGYFAAMVGVNAYNQPGVEAGKHAADVRAEAQRLVIRQLREGGQTASTTELARTLGISLCEVNEIVRRVQESRGKVANAPERSCVSNTEGTATRAGIEDVTS